MSYIYAKGLFKIQLSLFQNIVPGCLVGTVGGGCDSQSWGHEFDLHVGGTVFFKKILKGKNNVLEIYIVPVPGQNGRWNGHVALPETN